MVRLLSAALIISAVGCLSAQSNDSRALVEEGNQALAQSKLHDAAIAFQRAIDLDPSSAKAHEGLGVTLSREILDGNLRPSSDSDVSERAEDHLKRAVELAPSATKPLIALSELEAALGEHSPDATERSDRYRQARDALKQALALQPGKAGLNLQLANIERDEFSPVIQHAKGRSGSSPGPLSDLQLRHSLQDQYGSLINDAISNAERASQTDANSPKPLLLLWRLLEERAVLRDTAEDYTTDMHSAEDWERQFLSTGGHASPTK